MTFGDFFTELLFGAGAWIGILLILAIEVGLLLKWKYSGVLLLPVTLLLGIDYLTRNLAWQSIIMFVSAIFVLAYLVKK